MVSYDSLQSGIVRCFSSPSNITLGPYTNQVGGHKPIWKPRGGDIPLIYKQLVDDERVFYQSVHTAGSNLRVLQPFTPKFFGVPQGLNYLVLEDLVHGYERPCLLDIKLGRVQWSREGDEGKRLRQITKSLSTTSHSLGFRFCGSQMYDSRRDRMLTRDKYWGRALSEIDVYSTLKEWFSGSSMNLSSDSSIDLRLVQAMLLRMTFLAKVIASLGHFRFWSSSVLWYYDAAAFTDQLYRTAGVKLIDFANVYYDASDPSEDEETLLGLTNLIVFLAGLLRSSRAAN